ncbi:MAG: phospho-sugar mutase [Chlamydiae bacterium]|nr:phospho-sugar mutase [Chlamydiota bacterium]
MNLDTVTEDRIHSWTSGNFDADTKAEISKLKSDNPKLLRDVFYTELAFGTGGLRGIMGVGTNRINIYTIRKASLGLANYIKKSSIANEARVVIGFDSRNNSQLFAQETARVLAAQGIEVFLFEELRPTPYISFACRQLQCTAAVMITASHNPSEYNGYKVYWSDGAQIVPPHDQGIMNEVQSIKSYDDIPTVKIDNKLIHILSTDLDQEYINAIHGLQQRPHENQKNGKQLHITYSSLHGAGITLVPQSLKDWGFSNIFLVEQQCIPDGNFPTAKSPNPEYPQALALGIETMKKNGNDILFVTDPDADRLGVVVMHNGRAVTLNGNETASICTWYLCSSLKKKNMLRSNDAVVTTIVSTELIPTICKEYNIHCEEVLTGFKYIGEKIHLWETNKSKLHFLFGAEESYGYLVGTHARDKDAVVSCCLLAEIALYAKEQNKTLIDLLYDIYSEYGIFREIQYSIDFPPGKDGMDSMKEMMRNLRSKPLDEINNSRVLIIEDYLTQERVDKVNQKKEKINLPVSDVILYKFDNNSKVVVRPSGTEPKLKIYAGVRLNVFCEAEHGIKQCDDKLQDLINAIKQKLSL